MTRLTMSMIVSVPKERLWAVMSDYHGVAKYHPFVDSADKLGQQDYGVGAARRCNLYGGQNAIETVTQWDEGTGMTVELSGGTIPLKTFVATLRLRAVDHARTELSFTGDAEPKFGVLGKIFFALVGRALFKRMARRVFEGMEYYAVTERAVANKVPPFPRA